MESVLVIIFGETREYEHTFMHFKSNVLDVLQADLCLCVGDNARENKDNPFYKQAKYTWIYNEPEDWADALDFAQRTKGYKGNWRQLLKVKKKWLGGIKGKNGQRGSGAIHIFFMWLIKESIIKNNILNQFDRFIITRSDFIHRTPHVPLEFLDPNFIWIPNGEDHRGIMDRHIVAHRKDIIDVLSIADEIFSDPEKLYSKMSHYQKWNPEQYKKFIFDQMGLTSRIKRFPYTMYSIRSIDGKTRGSKGIFSPKFGYYVKYFYEYRSALTASKFVKEVSDWSKRSIFFINIIILIDRYINMIIRFISRKTRIKRSRNKK